MSQREGQVEAIRSRIREERERLSALSRAFKNVDPKHTTTVANNLLDDVEGYFLSNAVLKEPRTNAEWNRWLDGAERVMQLAIQQREHVDSMLEKYGPDVDMVGVEKLRRQAGLPQADPTGTPFPI